MKKVLALTVALAVLVFCSWAAAGTGCCSKAKATTVSAACEKAGKAAAADCESKTEQVKAGSVQVLKLSVAGMHCGDCSKIVQTALSRLDGVQEAKVSYTRKSAEVKYNPVALNEESIIQAVNATGFTATVKSAEAKMSSDGCCKAKKASKATESGT